MALIDLEIMDSSILSIGDENSASHVTKSNQLEFAYQESIRKCELILSDESVRRLRLRVLLLENENDDLHDQLSLEDDRIDDLEQENADLLRQLEQSEMKSHRKDSELRTHTRELSNLKAELVSMSGLSIDSTKQLAEKISLTRELATLKPELDHLRAQATYQQTILSEKLALQRQINALEVELEIAKNTSRRTAVKESGNSKEDQMIILVDDLRKELLKERREKEKAQMAAKKGSSELETRNSVLEGKIEAMRTNLRIAKNQLKDAQTELAQLRAAASKIATCSDIGDLPTKNPRKRTAVQMSADTAIGTPDGVAVRGKRPATKRGNSDKTALGEKSMFSITPYLNRTISVPPDTPKPDVNADRCANAISDPEDGSISNDHGSTHLSNDESPLVAVKTKPRRKENEKNILKNARSGATNKEGPTLKSGAVSTLEKVAEEGHNENEEPDTRNIPEPVDHMKKTSLNVHLQVKENTEPRKKRRKILGTAKTLFDEDDGEATRRPVKIILGPVKSLGRPSGNKNGSLGITVAGFGAFSPLKKDKRGTQASFLA